MLTRMFKELLQVLAAMSLHPADCTGPRETLLGSGCQQLLCSPDLCSGSEAAASSKTCSVPAT